MSEQSKINSIRIGSVIFLVLITLLLSKCFDNKNVPISEPFPILPAEIIEDTVKNEPVETVDTLGILKYCIDHKLYNELFPTKKVYKKEIIRDTIYLDTEPFIPEKDTVYNVNIINIKGPSTYNTKKQEEDKTRIFVGFGINTFPSASIMAGVMLKNNWGIAIESHYYFYHGTIKNATVPDNVNFIVRTKSAIAEEAPPIGYVEIPNFSVGLKVIKMF